MSRGLAHHAAPVEAPLPTSTDTAVGSLTDLQQDLERRAASAAQQALPGTTLALLQLSNFHGIRPWVGRSTAQTLLAEVESLLLRSLPREARLYRCRRYELVVLSGAGDNRFGKHLHHSVETALDTIHCAHLPATLRLRPAVGLTRLRPGDCRAVTVLARARLKLRRASSTPVVPSLSPALPSLEQLNAGLRQGQLQLLFQPVLALQPEQQPHYEVHCRLRGPGGPWSSQSLFARALPMDLGETLDHLVLNQALPLLCRNPQLQLTVNLCLNTLVSDSFLPWLSGRLTEHGAARQGLRVQINELDARVAQHHLGPFSEGLRSLGIGLGVSDVDITSNALDYLPLLHTSFVRLVPACLEGLRDGHERRQALTDLVARLRGRGIDSIVTGLEDVEALPLLWRAGVAAVQGNVLQAPGVHMRFTYPRTRRLR